MPYRGDGGVFMMGSGSGGGGGGGLLSLTHSPQRPPILVVSLEGDARTLPPNHTCFAAPRFKDTAGIVKQEDRTCEMLERELSLQ